MRFALVAFCGLALCGCENRVSIDKLDSLATDIFDGTISIDANGVATVDTDANVVGDEAHVTTLPSGKQHVLFTTWRGKASNLRGYLFTNGAPLVVGSEIEVVAFRPVRPNSPHVANVWINVDALVGKSVYSVSRSLD